MNRLVIVGNGFDLAHGLPTGYCDFIDWYWKNKIETVELFPEGSYKKIECHDEFVDINFKFRMGYDDTSDNIKREFANVSSFEDLKNFVRKYTILETDKAILKNVRNHSYNDCSIYFKSSFFQRITVLKSIQNWVDIENEYYKLLKNCLKNDKNGRQVLVLNNEFKAVKTLLERYLLEEVCQKFNFNDSENIKNLSQIFIKQPLFLDASQKESKYLKEFHRREHDNLISYDNQILEAIKIGFEFKDIYFTKNLFLNFNYTPTLENHLIYMKNDGGNFYGLNELIHIHGKIGDSDNLINFGFGDEMDEEYKMIENEDNNEYLKNIKSFQYLQNSNYKDMLDFIDSEKFQVYIMGHSCGLSDRILLNKIFEHHNCLSIKVFYHQFNEPKADGRADNYTEIVQNISRHFNKKEMMRERIVNKSLCQPLPQDIRFAKKENDSQE